MSHTIYKDLQDEKKDIKKTQILQALESEDLSATFDDALDNEMVLNMGPQHPATHGVLRLLLSLDGETVKNAYLSLAIFTEGMKSLRKHQPIMSLFLIQTGWIIFSLWQTMLHMRRQLKN